MFDHPLRSLKEKNISIPPSIGEGYTPKLSVFWGGATHDFFFLEKDIDDISLKLSVYVIIAINFHNQQKTRQNSHISMFYGSKSKIGIFSAKIGHFEHVSGYDVIVTLNGEMLVPFWYQ